VSLPENVVHISIRVLTVLIIFSVTIVLAKVGVLIVDHYKNLMAGLASTSSLLKNIVRISIYSIGILFILDYLEIHIAPLLTALGVGGLAIGLGLQETLSNFFAGLQILAANQIRVGDYIKLSSGDEGFVEDMNWRATVVRTLSGNHVIIPNKNLAGLIITNYQEPAPDMSIVFNLGVDYSSDLDEVERVTVEVAKEIQMTVPGAVRDFQPFIRFNEFATSSINFSVILRGKSYVDQYLIKHEFVKKLKQRYDKEGIKIPFPVRTVYLNQDDKKDG
ncbi:MAG: mechanosensitive ion channel family protein, partial [Candidatus Kryptoniota bacterium]